MSDSVRRVTERIAQELADQGRLIEAGWQIYRSLALQDVRSVQEIDRYRETFYTGASHLFTAFFTMLEPGTEETPGDMRRMNRLYEEVEPHERMLRLKYGRTTGSA